MFLLLLQEEPKQELLLSSSSLWVVTFSSFIFVVFSTAYLFYPAICAAWSANSNDSTKSHSFVVPTTIEKVGTVPANSTKYSSRETTENEDYYSPIFSIVIPAYNEEARLTHMLREAYDFFRQETSLRSFEQLAASIQSNGNQASDDNDHHHHPCYQIEWIVVDDGSTDQTQQVYTDFVKQCQYNNPDKKNDSSFPSTPSNNSLATNFQHCFHFLPLPVNCGKGAAVQQGMLHSTGQFALMVDADGATDFTCLRDFLGIIWEQKQVSSHTRASAEPLILLGSRRNLQKGQRSWVRLVLTQMFRIFMLVCIGSGHIQDTQCGFKLFPQSTIGPLFRNLHLRRWAFDTELIFRARALDMAMIEVDVRWQEIEGSKLSTSALNVALVGIGMLRDMICVRLCYTLGIWKI